MAYLAMKNLVSASTGRAFGVEVLGRLKEFKKINLVFSYTYVRSEFKGPGFKMDTLIVG